MKASFARAGSRAELIACDVNAAPQLWSLLRGVAA
jgi:hypothetical protein